MTTNTQTIKVNCQTFRRNPDGTWGSILTADINTATGSIRLPPGMTFKKGRTFSGVDVVTVLEQTCAR